MSRLTYQWRAQVARELVGVAEIAERTGKSKAAVWAITRRPDFMTPIQLGMGPVWFWSDVEQYLATPRRPGPKTRAASTSSAEHFSENDRLVMLQMRLEKQTLAEIAASFGTNRAAVLEVLTQKGVS